MRLYSFIVIVLISSLIVLVYPVEILNTPACVTADCVGCPPINEKWGQDRAPTPSMPGDECFFENDILVSVDSLKRQNRQGGFFAAQIMPSTFLPAFSSDKKISLGQIGLKFNFAGLSGGSKNYVSFKFATLGNAVDLENIGVETIDDLGVPIIHPLHIVNLEDPPRLIAPGVILDAESMSFPFGTDNHIGIATLRGDISALRIGGEQLLIDSVCVKDTTLSGPLSISGAVTMEIDSDPVPGVTMALTGDALDVRTTDGSGDYLFNMSPGDYTVKPHKAPYKVSDPGNVINFQDIARIAAFFFNPASLTEPQQRAADVNQSGIPPDFQDIALILTFLQGNKEPDNFTGEWRFIPSEWPYESLVISQFNQNFLVLLLGDVDGSWPGTVVTTETFTEEYEDLTDFEVSRGDEVIIPLTIPADANVLSAEIDFKYDPHVLRFDEAVQTDLSSDFQVVVNSESGRLHIGLYSGQMVNEAGVLLRLKFKVIGAEGSHTPLLIERYILNGAFVRHASKKLIVKH